MFELKTSLDFYTMVVADFDEFMAEQHLARRALHCAITAFHLYEWVWADLIKNDISLKSKFSIRDKESFLKWIDKHCVWFRSVQDLANGTKHFIPNQSFKTMQIVGFGQGPYGIGSYGQSYLLIDYGEDAGDYRWQPAAYLLEIVVRFWRDFFRRYSQIVDVPSSKHHVD